MNPIQAAAHKIRLLGGRDGTFAEDTARQVVEAYLNARLERFHTQETDQPSVTGKVLSELIDELEQPCPHLVWWEDEAGRCHCGDCSWVGAE